LSLFFIVKSFVLNLKEQRFNVYFDCLSFISDTTGGRGDGLVWVFRGMD